MIIQRRLFSFLASAFVGTQLLIVTPAYGISIPDVRAMGSTYKQALVDLKKPSKKETAVCLGIGVLAASLLYVYTAPDKIRTALYGHPAMFPLEPEVIDFVRCEIARFGIENAHEFAVILLEISKENAAMSNKLVLIVEEYYKAIKYLLAHTKLSAPELSQTSTDILMERAQHTGSSLADQELATAYAIVTKYRAVMAHEAGHYACGHVTRNGMLKKGLMLGGYLAAVFWVSLVEQKNATSYYWREYKPATRIVSALLSLGVIAYIRGHEHEADHYAVERLSDDELFAFGECFARWGDITESPNFFEKLQLTHPDHETRYKNVVDELVRRGHDRAKAEHRIAALKGRAGGQTADHKLP